MSGRSITSANSVLVLSAADIAQGADGQGASLGNVSPILGKPFRLEGWAAGRAFTSDIQRHAQTILGVDGRLSAGWIPSTCKLELNIMPNSSSIVWLNTIDQVQRARRETLIITGTLQIPSVRLQYSFTNGVLLSWQQIPSHANTLEAQQCQFEFESAQSSPLVG